MKKIKVLVVDDSALARQMLVGILSSDSALDVIGTASDPFIAARKIQHEEPDVITLDIEMPKMDGLTFLRRIMSQHPIPVAIISSLTHDGSIAALRALEYGAAEVICKPAAVDGAIPDYAATQIIDAVKAAAMAKIKRIRTVEPLEPAPKLSADAVIQQAKPRINIPVTDKIVAVGASTGGTEALRLFLSSMPPSCPGIVVVQHMPELFTASFAKRLNEQCCITVREATHGDKVPRGTALIAPGNKHITVKRIGDNYYVSVIEGEPVNRHRPSVDVLFRSVAQQAGKNSIGVIMTGMGDDGAKGLLEMKEVGAATIAQDEASCVVFGMPKEAIRLGAALHVVPLEKIATTVLGIIK